MTQQADLDLSDKIALIIGQTDYNADEAESKLKSKDYDEIAVIRDYLRLGTTTMTGDDTIITTSKSQSQSKNQLIYTEIRKFMDGCVRSHTV
jgi:hypothetical protein